MEGKERQPRRDDLVTDVERQLEHHGSDLENLVAALQRIPVREITGPTGYNSRTARRLKRGAFRPIAGCFRRLSAFVSSVYLRVAKRSTSRCACQSLISHRSTTGCRV